MRINYAKKFCGKDGKLKIQISHFFNPLFSQPPILTKLSGWLLKDTMTTEDSPRATVDLISTGTTISKDIPSEALELITHFYNGTGVFHKIKPEHNVKDSFSNLIGGVLKVITIQRGKISCLLTIKPPTLVPFFLFYLCCRFYSWIALMKIWNFCFERVYGFSRKSKKMKRANKDSKIN